MVMTVWVVISGLVRSGTTLGSMLLNLDPHGRSPLVWEVDFPIPPAMLATQHSDPRIAQSQKQLDGFHKEMTATGRIGELRFDVDNMLPMLPSEYFDRNIKIGSSNTRRRELGRRYEIGVDNIMWGNDFPHPEGTYPHTRYWIRERFKDVPEDPVGVDFTEHVLSEMDRFGVEQARLASASGAVATLDVATPTVGVPIDRARSVQVTLTPSGASSFSSVPRPFRMESQPFWWPTRSTRPAPWARRVLTARR